MVYSTSHVKKRISFHLGLLKQFVTVWKSQQSAVVCGAVCIEMHFGMLNTSFVLSCILVIPYISNMLDSIHNAKLTTSTIVMHWWIILPLPHETHFILKNIDSITFDSEPFSLTLQITLYSLLQRHNQFKLNSVSVCRTWNTLWIQKL